MFFLFKGRQLWAYKGYQLLPNYPMDMRKTRMYPKLILSAAAKNGNIYLLRVKLVNLMPIVLKINKKLYLLKGAHAFNFDTVNLKIKNDHPEMVSDIFPGLPYWVDAAVQYENVHYFFRDIWYILN